MSNIKDIDQLREEVLEGFEWVKKDPRRANQVSEMVNAAGKVVAMAKLQVEYAALRGEVPHVPFLGSTSGIPLGDKVRKLLSK
jgi:hypothetical protein